MKLKKLIPKFTKFRVILLIIILAVVGGGIYFYQYSQKKQPVEIIKAKMGDIRQTVSASGVLSGKESANLKFKIPGKISYLPVKENDEVVAGEVIAGLDTTEYSIALQQAKNSWLAKDATAKKVEDDVKDHDKDENFEQREERILAQTARDNAYDAIKAAEQDLRDTVIVSPISGTVIYVGALPNQNVSVADTIAIVTDTSEIYFDAEVDESDINKISLNQKAEVSLNNYPDKTFYAEVSKILPATKTTDAGATVVIVRLKLDPAQVRFISNINGQSEIITQEKKNVLVIPQDVLVEDNKVFVKDSEKYKTVELTLGISSATEVEVLEGLGENDEIVANPASVPEDAKK